MIFPDTKGVGGRFLNRPYESKWAAKNPPFPRKRGIFH